jgi:hypothetical protein
VTLCAASALSLYYVMTFLLFFCCDALWPSTRISSFQWHLTLIFFNVFEIVATTEAILAIWSAYLVKFLSVDAFLCF